MSVAAVPAVKYWPAVVADPALLRFARRWENTGASAFGPSTTGAVASYSCSAATASACRALPPATTSASARPAATASAARRVWVSSASPMPSGPRRPAGARPARSGAVLGGEHERRAGALRVQEVAERSGDLPPGGAGPPDPGRGRRGTAQLVGQQHGGAGRGGPADRGVQVRALGGVDDPGHLRGQQPGDRGVGARRGPQVVLDLELDLVRTAEPDLGDPCPGGRREVLAALGA